MAGSKRSPTSGPASTTQSQSPASTPSTSRFAWLLNTIIPFVTSLSRRATAQPVHTFVFIALLVNVAYLKLAETSLFEPPQSLQPTAGQLDFTSLLSGSKTLQISADTAWKWQIADDQQAAQQASQDLALMTLVFPESSFRGSSVPMPQPKSFSKLANGTFTTLPSSKNILSPISQESTLVFSVPMREAAPFAASVKELGVFEAASLRSTNDDDADEHAFAGEEKRWIMAAVKGDAGLPPRSIKKRAADAWNAFVDLLKNAEELDIVIMALGYISMHLTFVSLFMSMRRLGSNFWLGFAVLSSSVFALLFGLYVTALFGVPINMVLLSEGSPFLVVIIGFEKPIILTKAVLSAALALKKSAASSDSPVAGSGDRFSPGSKASSSIQRAVVMAVQNTGAEIIRDYLIEISILVLGAALGVQGGLCQFCFLAAWILFFDAVLLFTFYTAILTFKLEINRIKRHVSLRRALEEDGVSRKVAEEVAASDEWPKINLSSLPTSHSDRRIFDLSIFGLKARDSSVSRFKVLMSTMFAAIIFINVVTVPFRSGARTTGSALSSVVSQPPMDPFKVAGSALEIIATTAKKSKLSTMVTILAPIKYELQYPSIHYAIPDESSSLFDLDFSDAILDNFGGRVVESILKSFEDPHLGKWIVIALALSLILNGYLFNAARWSAHGISEAVPFTDASVNAPQIKAIAPKQRPAQSATTAPLETLKKTEESDSDEGLLLKSKSQAPHATRTIDECVAIWKADQGATLENEEIIDLLLKGKVAGYELEKKLGDMTRAVQVRRSMVARTPVTRENTSSLERSKLPYQHYEYERVFGACCENVIGYMPIPLGVAGPLVIDGKSYFLPMATTEGVLVASTSRGCKAINAGGGAVTVLTADGMTRGPCVGFSTLARAAEAKVWIDSPEGRKIMMDAFNSTSRFARLQTMKTSLAGTYLYIRFKTTTGDAMGMNMISKGVEHALSVMSKEAGFDDMAIISVSGNFCIDKKPSAINWIDGRGKSIVAEAIIPGDVVKKVLKSDVNALVELNVAKNLIGSAMAGSVGGNNAHAANIVAAIFLATGQDPAQVTESCSCITTMRNFNGDLQIAVSMPCIEVGTIGGGTFLPPQASMLDLLGVRGAHPTAPGSNSRQLARIIGAAVLAGELSLCSALAAGHLVRAHMQHNRAPPAAKPVAAVTAPAGSSSTVGVAGPR